MNPYATWASNLLRGAVILDTETTGLDDEAQIIQLAIIDMQGNTLFDSLLRPSCEISAGAAAVHRITADRLIDAPTIVDVIDDVTKILFRNKVITYNADFDTRMLRQTLSAYKLDAEWMKQIGFQCAMKMYAESIGSKKWLKLTGGDHSAIGDCKATLELLRRMAVTI